MLDTIDKILFGELKEINGHLATDHLHKSPIRFIVNHAVGGYRLCEASCPPQFSITLPRPI